MRTKRIVLMVLLVLNCLTIFIFSNQDGRESSALSDGLTTKIVDVYVEFSNRDLTNAKKQEIVLNSKKLVRKTAHFTIYLTLGLITYLLLCTYYVKHSIIISLIFTLFYACTDEFHQLFIAGRSGEAKDILIDVIGSYFGVLIGSIVNKLKRRQISI